MTTSRTPVPSRRKLIPEMEGPAARWYARMRGSEPQLAAYRDQARDLSSALPPGSAVLEVACGPGYLSIELARLGLNVSALDIARAFVSITAENARRAGVAVDVRHGDAADMPFEAGSFDLVICQAAFKNFTLPVAVLDEMHRVLQDGGTAIVQDMRHEATAQDIAAEVERQGLSLVNGWITRRILRWLRRRAYRAEEFEGLASKSAFGGCIVRSSGIELEARLIR